jgi:hypothetical protein
MYYNDDEVIFVLNNLGIISNAVMTSENARRVSGPFDANESLVVATPECFWTIRFIL